MALLEMKGIRKSFSGVPVLKGVDLTVEKGEIHALLGENGAGKSTLMNVLTGTIPCDGGSIKFDGQDLKNITVRKSEQLGIAFVHQELNLFNDLRVFENVFINREITGAFGKLNKKEMIRQSEELFERLGIKMDPKAMVSDLRTGDKQLLEISKALLTGAKLLILDEPTTSLNNDEVEHLFGMVKDLKNKGISFIFISHKMPEIFAYCDSYTVFRNGELIGSGKIADTTPPEVTKLMVGHAEEAGSYEKRKTGDTVLKLENLSGKGFKNISFEVKKGEIIGLTGLQGCGSSELLQCLFGITAPIEGTLEINGKPVKSGSVHKAMKAGVGLLPANRKETSVIPDMSLVENMYLAEQTLSAGKFHINRKAEMEKYDRYQKQLNIKAESGNSPIVSLSGGNQQKVFIARWLNTDANILLFDNPTQGIDVGAKEEIYKLILSLANEGKTVLVNTLEIPELQKVADKCLIFYEGQIAGTLSHEEIEEHTVMMMSTGLTETGAKKNDNEVTVK
ncbi:sugar ABC transporter ATP-binding protein [Butyrivibrio sp. WCD2001]|uniref:sugar ABC transporter ATP-binding protein n=1 Tax=Butyrivibrio sp. WCD2001 TaxID=1280681 RepID=UPI0004087F46|nr:sugar ABC transporter ATP-binding protein [Butyrivibrio sp. WCD2001]